MDLADNYMQIVSEMRSLAKELLIPNPAKLLAVLAVAKGKIPGASLKLAQLALEDNVGKQALQFLACILAIAWEWVAATVQAAAAVATDFRFLRLGR